MDLLNDILVKLDQESNEVEACAVISNDGLIRASQLKADMDDDRVGAMTATMLSLGDRISKEFQRGQLEQVLIKGENGYVLMVQAGKNAVLCALAPAQVKLGLFFLDVRRAALKVSQLNENFI